MRVQPSNPGSSLKQKQMPGWAAFVVQRYQFPGPHQAEGDHAAFPSPCPFVFPALVYFAFLLDLPPLPPINELVCDLSLQ